MITELWLSPPLAMARLGSSPNPCENFEWGPTDVSPGGTGKTTLRPLDSLSLDDEGRVTETPKSSALIFKDQTADGTWQFRPVCPYFELFGNWEIGGEAHSGAITRDVLQALGLSASDITWRVRLANLKAYQFTLSEGDRIESDLVLNGTNTARQPMVANSPHGPDSQKLIPDGENIPVSEVQISLPTDAFPEFRLRFHPPKGLVYGPTDLQARIAARPDPGEWVGFDLEDRFIVNSAAAWPNYRFGQAVGPPFILPADPALIGRVIDSRKTPSGIHAQFGASNPAELDDGVSLGLVDDVTDGIVECSIGDHTAFSRIAVGPPDFAPDRRHIISLQEGLADRVDREGIRQNNNMDELEELVRDIFERALETSDLMNKDTELDRRHGRPPQLGQIPLPRATGDRDQVAIGTTWPTRTERASTSHRADALPVSFAGSRKHKRYTALEYLRDRLREDPQLLDKWIRKPRDEYQGFDRRMPPLMRGSHGGPMNLTQRQYELLTKWVEGLRQQGLIG